MKSKKHKNKKETKIKSWLQIKEFNKIKLF